MRDDIYQGLSPKLKARYDWREEGAGQDSNPYDKEKQRTEFDEYAWEMHRIWTEDFNAEQQLAASIAKEESTSARNRPEET